MSDIGPSERIYTVPAFVYLLKTSQWLHNRRTTRCSAFFCGGEGFWAESALLRENKSNEQEPIWSSINIVLGTNTQKVGALIREEKRIMLTQV